MSTPLAEIGVIAGSGFYAFLPGAEPVETPTPYGAPSEPPVVGEVSGRRVAFIPRHGADHRYGPRRLNYRANLWALRALGVRQVLAPCAVGSLRPALGPGTTVVPDQVVDRTAGRNHTLYDDPDRAGAAVHVAFADPYCAAGRSAVVAAGNGSVVDGATMVVIDGPRFSSRAESRWHAAQGWSLVGMTGQPEASLARELALCYTAVALVTDHDAGVEAGTGVTQAEVLARFAAGIDDLKQLLAQAIGTLPPAEPDETATCPCRRALDGLDLPFELP